jgi:hypothetical protein
LCFVLVFVVCVLLFLGLLRRRAVGSPTAPR